MLRIRRVPDDSTPANASAIQQAQAILRAQFSGMPAYDVEKLTDQLRDPMKHRFRALLYVAEDTQDRVRGFAVLLHAPDLAFCYLETIATAPGQTGGGIGAALYERVRESAAALGVVGIFCECLPDDPALSPNPAIRRQNVARLRFYERFGARPIANTAYETPLSPGDTDPPYLVFDGLGTNPPPGRNRARAIVRAILERKYGDICPPGYIDRVVASISDDPIVLRAPRYGTRNGIAKDVKPGAEIGLIALVVNDRHEIHHVRDRGYVESPIRIRSVLAEIEKTGLFRRLEPRRFGARHIRAVHDGALVDYLERVCKSIPEGDSLYPYVFPIRNPMRVPRERSVTAGYFCIDTFTPLNANAWKAARGAVDCALTAAEEILAGSRLAYALVRPPGHHAERRVFGGFCYFNNAAVAAHRLSRYGRVAVLDIDYHHGNGTQDIFYERDDVLTVSIHGHPRFAYPYFSGFREETGREAGAGCNLNIPLGEKIGPAEWRAALATALRRIELFDPAYLVVANGFDTAKGDPTGTWQHAAADFEWIGATLGEAGWPTLIVQEGGYRVRTLGTNARNFFNGLYQGASRAKPRLTRPRPIAGPGPVWREAVREADIAAIRRLVAESGYFTGEETGIAAELVEERVRRGRISGYEFILAEIGTRIAGYACYGPIPGTERRFDLYWIVVDESHRGTGLGRQILSRVETAVRRQGGERLYAETSSTEHYAPTRAFYDATGFEKVAELPDFYRSGDGNLFYMKDLSR
jgi:acetoin utilization deacetylase AcuC-like enzyme/GNAT superfamily N-acetyltransferase